MSKTETLPTERLLSSRYVSTVTVIDPDSGDEVEVEIRKLETGAMVGLDGSWLQQFDEHPRSPYDDWRFWVPVDEVQGDQTDTRRDTGSGYRFLVGDCVIIGQADRPCTELVAVVVSSSESEALCKYLQTDLSLDFYNDPGLLVPHSDLTHVCDFGVDMHTNSSGQYWCERRGESVATYRDGVPRQWQDHGDPVKMDGRPDLLAKIG